MRSTLRWLGPAVLGLTAVTGCGGDSVGPKGGGSGALSAQIDGQAWTADASRITVTAGSASIPGSLVVTGTKVLSATDYTTISLEVGYIAGAGTYPLGVNLVSTAGGIGQVIQQSASAFETRQTGLSGNGGTLTVNLITNTRIVGTFSFTATPILSATYTGSRNVTSGSFDLPLPAGFVLVPANNYGSSVGMKLNGAGWNAATIVGIGSSGVFGITATTDAYSVSLTSVTAVTGAGSYALGTNVTMSVIETATGHSWGGTTNQTGTVTITSLAGGRVAGTVSGTLTGTAGSLAITAGAFDVKLGS